MRLLLPALATIRAPLAITALVIALLILPDQSREVFVALQEAGPLALLVGIAQAVVTIGLFLLILALAGLLAIKAPTGYRRTAIVQHENMLQALALAAPAVVLVALVLLNLDAAGIGGERRFASLLWLVPAAAAVFLALWSTPAFCRKLAERMLRIPLARPWLTFRRAGLLVLSTFALCVAWSILHVLSFSALLGTIGVVFLFLSILTAAASLLARIYDEWHWPITTILIAAALLFSYIPLNDNHEIRIARGNFPPADAVHTSFLEWLKRRPDRENFVNRPYPVYIVAAEGGGIYAAAHTAWTLAGLQDECPQFAHHLFAISGVSGGSVGASLFSALLDLEPPPEKPPPAGWCNGPPTGGSLRNRVKLFFETDLLTPVLSAGLFPDFLQRFLFFRVPPFDRSRALEDALERAWHRVTLRGGESAAPSLNKNLAESCPQLKEEANVGTFDKSLLASWCPLLSRPALLLNTTAVQFGERIILAPFTLYQPLIFEEGYTDILNNARDKEYWKRLKSQPFRIPLRVAATLSARFPFVTPPGTLPADTDDRAPIQVADGGYYDNSAILTAVSLADRLKVAAVTPGASVPGIAKSDCANGNMAWFALPESKETIPVCFRFIVIRRSPSQYTAAYRGDFVSPLATFKEVWTARGISTYSTLRYRYCGGSTSRCGSGHDAKNPHVYVHSISPQILKGGPDEAARTLPTGWMLSRGTFESIFHVAEHPLDCKSDGEESRKAFLACRGQGHSPKICTPRIENLCLVDRVRANLTGEPL